MNESTPLISIIIPIYNREALIGRCVKSIQTQTYQNLEIFLVDDGSTDNSYKLCQEFAEEDSRIKVLKKENGGASSARNYGLKYVTGEYVVFVDSDDYVLDKYVEDLYRAFPKEEKAALVISGVLCLRDGVETMKLAYDDEIVEREIFGLSLTQKKFYRMGCGPCSKLYVRKIIEDNNLRFDENSKNYEDFLFNMHYIEHIKAIAFSSSVTYIYDVSCLPTRRLYSADHELHILRQFSDAVQKYPYTQAREMWDWQNVLAYTTLLSACNLSLKEFSGYAKACIPYFTLNFSYVEQRYWKVVCYCAYYKLFWITRYLCRIRLQEPSWLTNLRKCYLKLRGL